MASEDGRAEAALSVLRGVSVAQVAEERGVAPEVVLQWVDLFCEGGEARLDRESPGRPSYPGQVPDVGSARVPHPARDHLRLGGHTALVPRAQIREEALASIRRQVSHLERVARDALDAGAVARGKLRLIVAPVKFATSSRACFPRCVTPGCG